MVKGLGRWTYGLGLEGPGLGLGLGLEILALTTSLLFTDVSVGVYWILAVKSRLSQPDAFQTMPCRHVHER